jgi:hypothetical protein
VTENLGIESDPTALIDDLKVDQPTDIEILQTRYRDSNPVRRGAWRTDRLGVARLSAKEAASREILERAQDLGAEIMSSSNPSETSIYSS